MAKDTSSKEYEDLKAELRSLLISSAGGCTEQQLRKDYATYNGNKQIPFQQMGYKTLFELLDSMPDVARVQRSTNPVTILGVADSNTAHIQKFVAQQKKKKGSRPAPAPVVRYSRANNYYPLNTAFMYPASRPSLNKRPGNGVPFQPFNHIDSNARDPWASPVLPSTAVGQWRPMAAQQPSSSLINNPIQNITRQTTTSMSSASTNRTVASFPPKDSQTARSPSPPQHLRSEVMSTTATPIMDDDSSMPDEDAARWEDEALASFDAEQANKHGERIVLLRKRIRQLLLKHPNIWLSSVPKFYKKMFAEDLNLEDYGMKNLMAFFDCIGDFVESRRDPLPDSSDRLILLQPAMIEASKRERQTDGTLTSSASLPRLGNPQHTSNGDSTVPRSASSVFDRPIVDLSSFVPLDFHYKRIEYTSKELFEGFLGSLEDPWLIHLGNNEFVPKRAQMMAELQDHYQRSADQSIYVIPFEQLEVNLSCVYLHSDGVYYRAFIMQADFISDSDVVILKVYLVDFGFVISDVMYQISSTTLKFLHKKFAALSTQVYDCRLANIDYPSVDAQWSTEAQDLVLQFCQDRPFFVEVVERVDSIYYVWLWLDPDQRHSINQMLVQRTPTLHYHEPIRSEIRDSSSRTYVGRSSRNVHSCFFCFRPLNATGNTALDERRLSHDDDKNVEYEAEERNFKHFVISIEHAYYFVKHPYTRRPCLPCFEVARLLKKSEGHVLDLNLIREARLKVSDAYRSLFEDLRRLPESSGCQHIKPTDQSATVMLYDLSSVRDHLIHVKFRDGDVIDAFQREYDAYERPGYWHEKESSYADQENRQLRQENLSQRRDLLKWRRDQLMAMPESHTSLPSQDEMQDIEHQLNKLNGEIHTVSGIQPVVSHTRSSALRPAPSGVKTSSKKMRQTLYQIARPFDQQFSLKICFDHQPISDDHLAGANDLDERFEDLHRVARNVTQFFALESHICDESQRELLLQVSDHSGTLSDPGVTLDRRAEVYNYCLEVIEHFLPMIQSYVQRTDLLDAIW